MPESEPEAPPGPREVALRDLRPTRDPIIIVARVVSFHRREIVRRSDGSRRPVLSGTLSDGTASVRFTWWDPPEEEIERGTVLRAGPVEVREYRGRPEVSFGWRTRVAPASDAELPEVALEERPAPTVAELSEGDDGFRLDVRVGEEVRRLFEGSLFDGTGTIGFSAWTDLSLSSGQAIRIVGGSVRRFRGRPSLVLDERSEVSVLRTSELPALDEWLAPPPTAIGNLGSSTGASRVAVEGLVVALLPPSGLVDRCPSCGRRVVEGRCRSHGEVAAEPDLRARIVLDDGSGAITIAADRALTERLWGRTLAEVLADVRDHPDGPPSEEGLFAALLGRRLRAIGETTSDEFGLTLYPELVESLDAAAPDLRELRSLLERVGG